MTTVLLVRHGQASFGTSHYDRLSELGADQARRAGSAIARRYPRVTSLLSGGLERQQESARAALTEIPFDGDVRPDIRFNEYRTKELFAAYLAAATESDPIIAAAGESWTADRVLFWRVLRQVTQRWSEDKTPPPAMESWPAFRSRVASALQDALADLSRSDVAVIFTSAGVIAAAVGIALDLRAAQIFSLNWRIYNASICTLHYGTEGFALAGFNEVGHLAPAGSQTILTYW
jgi:broad specificity phosphatase PhoE